MPQQRCTDGVDDVVDDFDVDVDDESFSIPAWR